eukprot:SAG31_NODE_28435_length_410_cov_0.983923_1_plen_105_part_10
MKKFVQQQLAEQKQAKEAEAAQDTSFVSSAATDLVDSRMATGVRGYGHAHWKRMHSRKFGVTAFEQAAIDLYGNRNELDGSRTDAESVHDRSSFSLLITCPNVRA